MRKIYQDKLDEAFELEYPQLIEFKDVHTHVMEIYIETMSVFQRGFIAGLEATGLSQFEIYEEGFAGFIIKLAHETMEESLAAHYEPKGGGLYETSQAAKSDAILNGYSEGYQIYAVKYNKEKQPEFEEVKL